MVPLMCRYVPKKRSGAWRRANERQAPTNPARASGCKTLGIIARRRCKRACGILVLTERDNILLVLTERDNILTQSQL